MKESQVKKALHKKVIFVRRVVMLRKTIGLREATMFSLQKVWALAKRL